MVLLEKRLSEISNENEYLLEEIRFIAQEKNSLQDELKVTKMK